MVSVTKIFEFGAAHHLPDHPGLCKHLHGHNYKVEITITGKINEKTGMVIDFGDLKKMMKPILKLVDHQYLNDNPTMKMPPTAENMTIYFRDHLDQFLKIRRLFVERVRVWETSTSYAEWVRGT